MNKKIALTVMLNLLLSFAVTPIVDAENSGGVLNKPNQGDYSGSLDGINVTHTRGNVYIDSDVQLSVIGGYSNSNNVVVSFNKITVVGGNLADVHSGYAEGDAIFNEVHISGEATNIRAKLYGAYSWSGHANNNKVYVTEGKIVGEVYGGKNTIGGSAAGNTNENQVYISGGQMGNNVYGAYGNIDSTSNLLDISGGTIAGNVTGGRAEKGRANDNVLNIEGGEIKGDVYGGYGMQEATGNTVSVSKNAVLSVNSAIYGGYTNNMLGTGDFISNNTLNWNLIANVKQVGNFEYYNFAVPAGTNPNDVILKVSGGTETALDNSKIRLVAVEGDRKWRNGEKVILINNDKGITGSYNLISGQTISGLRIYNYSLSSDDKNIIATIGKMPKPDHSQSLSEARIAGLSFLNTAADLVADGGLQSAVDTAGKKYDIFGKFNYVNHKIKSGSDNNLKGTSLLLGFNRKLNTAAGGLIVGAFLESGNSSYDTSMNFDDFMIYAQGKNNYFGGGLMVRNVLDNGLYLEGSARIGRISTDYNSYDTDSSYDIRSTYYGLHLGIGKILKTGNKTELDIYSKYFWSHQKSASALIKGDTIKFDSLDSNRLRIGVRLNMLGSGHGLKSYIGLAYEHEFSASAGAYALDSDIAAPAIRGGTGVGEIGLMYKSTAESNFSMAVGFNGYVGKRQGLGGGIRLNWGF